ncbi:dipeptide epimerase [Rhizobiales bacterium]|uniref:N-acetyl-D-Glu racemase DgcA n=1 Tax=Hongsoonwoonella zoysiae TaxID=2821844 RepID=UPI00155FA3B9|nr:N-acetyl-D-Glu racemase DgcA [Hongsoonwoonella zoysiae]NRG17979.1 dipeptide epimerase [Hongsoonwoonella zoysiae]
MTIELSVVAESWPIEGGFTISRGSRTHADVVVVTLREGTRIGRGECVPYPRYGETVSGVISDIEKMAKEFAHGLDRAGLQLAMPAGAARNALDCALWDFEAKRAGKSVSALLGRAEPSPLVTAFTISVGSPEKMASDAEKAKTRPLLKVKLAGDSDPERIAAVRSAAPKARLIVDANEAWTAETFEKNLAACADAKVELIEQPLPAGDDMLLARIKRTVPVCADESAHTSAGLGDLRERYDAVNVKLDKTGGLTEALVMVDEAKALGFKVMVGCMLGTSLAMAPAAIAAQGADFVDLDAPLLLSSDRIPGLSFEGSTLLPPSRELWG